MWIATSFFLSGTGLGALYALSLILIINLKGRAYCSIRGEETWVPRDYFG